MKTVATCIVTSRDGTYTTNVTLGTRASCAVGPQQAAEALGRKLCGSKFARVEKVGETKSASGHFQTIWNIRGVLSHGVTPKGQP